MSPYYLPPPMDLRDFQALLPCKKTPSPPPRMPVQDDIIFLEGNPNLNLQLPLLESWRVDPKHTPWKFEG